MIGHGICTSPRLLDLSADERYRAHAAYVTVPVCDVNFDERATVVIFSQRLLCVSSAGASPRALTILRKGNCARSHRRPSAAAR